MVEIKQLKYILTTVATGVITLACIGMLRAQQPPTVEPRIAGLENNAEYMEALRSDAQLQIREDSIAGAIDQVREQLRNNPEQRQELSQEILRLENQIFDLRNAKGRLIDKINTIEQDWVLANLDAATSPAKSETQGKVQIPESEKRRNLVYNNYLRDQLSAEDYHALLQAQQLELTAVDYANRFHANYLTISELADSYAAAQSEDSAIEIFDRYTTLQRLNNVLADSLSQTWNSIFDNKSYAYGYLLDKIGAEELLTREEEQLSEAARQLAAIQDQTASTAVADYFLRKRVMTDYELSVAELLELTSARDSLQSIRAQLNTHDFNLPRIEVAERYFLQYDSITFPANQQYSYQHPIPECKVYSHGVIYRILLGRFNTKRAASTFRGAYPLCYQIDADSKWNYYAGGFATREEAEEGVKGLKAKGFTRPEIVVWNDGEPRNLSRDSATPVAVYRVEISGAEQLSEVVKQLIATNAEGYELSRVGQQLFVIGVFEERAVAEQIATALREEDPALEIKVAEIAE